MNSRSIEIKSALWQQLFILPIALLFCAVGVAAILSPFVPIFATAPRGGSAAVKGTGDIILALFMGVSFVISGFCLWWTVFKYSIKADETGIRQTNGFFTQTVRWADVDSYYMEPNRRYYGERRLHVEPVMFDSTGNTIFHGFAHLLVSTRKIIEQRRALWQFVEEQLEGKKKEAPSPDRDPEVLAAKSLQVDWSKKSPLWKVGRMLALVLYALFWLGLSMLPIYYIVSHNITLPKPWALLIMLPMFVGPLLPHIIWLKMKKRKIEREMKIRDKNG